MLINFNPLIEKMRYLAAITFARSTITIILTNVVVAYIVNADVPIIAELFAILRLISA